jgi:hypothetical protein
VIVGTGSSGPGLVAAAPRLSVGRLAVASETQRRCNSTQP